MLTMSAPVVNIEFTIMEKEIVKNLLRIELLRLEGKNDSRSEEVRKIWYKIGR